MRVLNLSLDKQILEKDSAVQKRLIAFAGRHGTDTEQEHGTETEEIEMATLVPAERDVIEQVSPHLTVYGVGGAKVVQLFKMWKMGKRILSDTTSLNPPSKEGGVEMRKEKNELKKYNLITVQDTAYLAFLAYLLARRFRIPFEVQVHGLEKFNGIRRWLAGFVLRRTDKVRVVSERLKRDLYSIFHIPYSKIYVLPVYTQIESLIPAYAKASSGRLNPSSLTRWGRKTVPYHFTFLTVGRLVSAKNIGLQIRALAKIAKQVPHVRLQIVGSGPEHARLELEAKSLKLEASVLFEGKQENPARFYEEADAFLLTSDSEGWGLVVTEAAAYGLPIIMTDVGLAGEFIKNNENGIVISLGDEDALITAMKRLIENAELRARLGAAARASFLALPSAEAQIQKQIRQWKNMRAFV